MTRAQYLGSSLPVPVNLFSHADQQQQWQTCDVSGPGTTGWAGRTADNIQSIYNGASIFPPVTSVAGSAIFCTGNQTQPYAMIPGSTPALLGFELFRGVGGAAAGAATIADV